MEKYLQDFKTEIADVRNPWNQPTVDETVNFEDVFELYRAEVPRSYAPNIFSVNSTQPLESQGRSTSEQLLSDILKELKGNKKDIVEKSVGVVKENPSTGVTSSFVLSDFTESAKAKEVSSKKIEPSSFERYFAQMMGIVPEDKEMTEEEKRMEFERTKEELKRKFRRE